MDNPCRYFPVWVFTRLVGWLILTVGIFCLERLNMGYVMTMAATVAGIGCALDQPASTNTGGSVRVVGDACGGVSADAADVTRG